MTENSSESHLVRANITSLPKGWACVSLNDICANEKNSIKRGPFGSTIKKEYFVKSGYKVYEQKNVIYNNFELGSYYIDGHKFNELHEFELRGGDIIISCSGTIGKVALAPDNIRRGVINQALLKITLDRRLIIPRFFVYLFSSKIVQEMIPTRGTAMKNISSVKILKTSILPLPPLSEQQRIIAKLEQLFTKLDAAEDALKKTKMQLKNYRQSILKHAFEGRLTEKWRNIHKKQIESSVAFLNRLTIKKVRRDVPHHVDELEVLRNLQIPDSWTLMSIADLLRKGILIDVKDGNHGSNHPKAAEFSSEGLPFITATQVRNFKIDYETAPKLKGAPLERLKVGFSKPNDVILTHKGSVGRVAISTRECVMSPQTTYYRVNRDVLSEHYLAYILASPLLSTQISSMKSQTTRDFVSISKQYKLFILLPALTEQHRIVEEIERCISVADSTETVVKASIIQSERLRHRISRVAFEGGLVLQHATDEPANVVLKRIAQEKVKHENKTVAKRIKVVSQQRGWF